MSLRSGAVEAIGMVIAENPLQPRIGSGTEQAGEALDALLDYLTEHREAWWTAWFESERTLYDNAPYPQHLPQLLAVLRGDKETP
jgi:hypothetical protein